MRSLVATSLLRLRVECCWLFDVSAVRLTRQLRAAQYPHGIKFVIATFTSLFGTANATAVRDWCVQWGWPLVWALGTNSGESDAIGPGGVTAVAAVDGMDRVLDPLVLRQIPAGRNISIGNGTQAAFAALWGAVNASRAAARSHGTRDGQPAPRQFAGWWAELKRAVPPALRVGALRAGDCADTDGCLGLGRDGHCVCNRH